MIAIKEDNLLATIIKGSLALLAILTIAGFSFFSTKIGLGILAGGLIAVVNFIWMRNVFQRILGLLPPKPSQYALMRFIARMTVMSVVFYLILTSGRFSLAGLFVGLSVIVANIIAHSLYRALRTGG